MPGINSQVRARYPLFKISCNCVVLSYLCCSVVIVLCCYLGCSVIIVLFYVLIVCTVTLPPGVNPIAVDKYIISNEGRGWSDLGPREGFMEKSKNTNRKIEKCNYCVCVC